MQDLTFVEIRRRVSEIHLPVFDLVVGIANGGLVPANLVAYKLGIDLLLVKINYRDEKNNPRYDVPKLLDDNRPEIRNKKLLIVDDVSVTGKTLETVKELFPGNEIKTLVFKGKADFVLFPEVGTCVNWPWKI